MHIFVLLMGCSSWEEADFDKDNVGFFDGDCWIGNSNPIPPTGALDHGVQAEDIYVGAEDLPYDGIDANCDGKDDFDADEDGFIPIIYVGIQTLGLSNTGLLSGGDCLDDPSLAPEILTADSIFPGAEDEWYDGIDADCAADSDFDADGDGFDSSNHEQPDGSVGGDCNDGSADINPSAEDIPLDAIDSDCNGKEICYEDLDGDGVGTTNFFESTSPDCSGDGASALDDDCDDDNSEIFPGAVELAADGIDSDCDAIELCYEDLDGDGYGLSIIPSTDLTCLEDGFSPINTDCDDENDAVSPMAMEQAGDGFDQNCDGLEFCYEDLDGDGYRTEETVESSNIDCSGSTESLEGMFALDCDDSSSQTYPGAAYQESTACMLDADGDGYGSENVSSTVTSGGDCNDGDAGISPSATEICDGGIDNDCDGDVDIDDTNLDTSTANLYYDDSDGDGYGDPTEGDYYCIQPSGTVSDNSDCDDENSIINPNTIWYADGDGDGYGLSTNSQVICEEPSGYVLDNTDCNDGESTIFPTAIEAVGDEVDQNCDGVELCYEDLDGDGYRTANTRTSTDIDCIDTEEAKGSADIDCDDGDSLINPNASEICDGGVDNNCNGTADDNDTSLDTSTQTLLFEDDDGDGYGNPSMDALFCSIESGWVTDNSDCDDTETSINPGETEITGDGVDQNCDEKEICYFDGDNDGYGGTTTLLSALGDVSCTNSNRALLSGDCQDTVFSVNPGQTDTVGDTVDNNCDGIDGVDADDDYFASEASGGTDCNDNNGDAYPMAEEYPGIIDLNCDGFESTDNDCFSSFDGSTYYLYCDSYVSWSTARDNCEDNGYELTSIRDSTENTHVQDNLFTTSWIGYRDTDSSKSCIGSTENVRFTWTDGYFGYYDIEYDWCTTSTNSSGYNNWKSGEPNNSNADEGCAEVYKTTGKWNDRDCDATRYYVCSMR